LLAAEVELLEAAVGVELAGVEELSDPELDFAPLSVVDADEVSVPGFEGVSPGEPSLDPASDFGAAEDFDG